MTLLTAPILLPQERNQSSGTKNFDPVNRPIGQCFVLCCTAPDTAPASLRLAHPQPSRASEHGSQGQSKQGGCLKEIARGGYIINGDLDIDHPEISLIYIDILDGSSYHSCFLKLGLCKG